VFETIGNRGDDRRGAQPDEDQDCACDAGIGFGEVVGFEDLVEKGGDAVEEAYVDGEWDEDEVELEGSEDLTDLLPERSS
jgi:hypothetical protein